MRKIGIKELFEAMHPSQLTGAYQVSLWNSEEESKITEWPVFFKKQGVLVADVVPKEQTSAKMAPHVTVYVFGTKEPYKKLQSFMDNQYGIQLDDADFGVGLLMDDRLPAKALPDIREVHQHMQRAMSKAKVM